MDFNFRSNTTRISAQGQLKLLDLAFSRQRQSISMIPGLALPLSLLYFIERETSVLIAWALFYLITYLIVESINRWGYQKNRRQLTAEQVYSKWSPILQTIGLIHGLAIGAPAVFIAATLSGKNIAEAEVLLLFSLGTIIATNTPVLKILFLFYLGRLVSAVLPMFWLFPSYWLVVTSLLCIYAVVLYQRTIVANQALVEQIFLEESSAQMAQTYKGAKDQAEVALRDKALFLSTASHDLRQPVHAIGMLVEAISIRGKDPSIAPLVTDLKISVASLNAMFTSLLDLSRFEAEDRHAKLEPLDAGSLIREVVALFYEDAQRQHIQLKMRLPQQSIFILGDPELLRRALSNLLQNALRYTSDGGVLVALRQRQGHWRVEVWDSGIGIAAIEQEKIFSPHYRSASSWQHGPGGYGLGLHVVARCAKLMGTDIGISSRLGVGSRFWIQLGYETQMPLNTSEEFNALPGSLGETFSRFAGRCLLVEDDPQVISAWCALLDHWGVRTRIAGSKHEAIDLIEAGFAANLIFCDQRLVSGDSGIEILKLLLNKIPDAHGAVISGEFASTELQQAESDGYIVLRKPVITSELHALIARWLS